MTATVKFTEIIRGTGVVQEVYGSGFAPGESVTATVHSDPFDLVAKANQDGAVTFTFPVSDDFALGDHYAVLVGATSGQVPNANSETDFVVLAAQAGANGNGDSGGGGLAETGASIGLALPIGAAALILLGGTLLVVSRVRRKSQGI